MARNARRFFLHARLQVGVTLVEMSVVLVIVGLLSWAAFSGYQTVNDQRNREQGQAMAREAQSHLRTFSMRNGRLPCPDTSATGNGLETLTGGVCGAGAQVGWFPYASVGMVNPAPEYRARYAAFRAPNSDARADADLTVAKERTGDALGELNYLNVNDLVAGLNNAAALPRLTTRAYITGDDGAAGPIDCNGNIVAAAAYWLVVPLKDRSGAGRLLDAPHLAASLCAASPSAPIRQDFDDVVLYESPSQLAGWLRQSVP